MNRPIIDETREVEFVYKINSILSSGFDHIEALLEEGKTNANIIKTLDVVYIMIDQMFDAIAPYLVGVKKECDKGCDYCCDIRVSVLEPEAIIIAKHIKEMGEENEKYWISKLEKYCQYSKDKYEYGFKKKCVFVGEDGACQIYRVRPYKCRMYHSINKKTCMTNRQAHKIGAIDQVDSLMVKNVIDIFNRNGLTLMSSELGQSVLIALRDPVCTEGWIAGESPFPLLPEYWLGRN